MTAPAGILPYDSTDASIILRCDCRSLAEVTAAGGVEPNAGTNEFDATLGFKALGTNGGLRFVEPAGFAALDLAGQVSFEIESKAISDVNAGILSDGENWGANTYLLLLRDSTAANYLRLLIDSAERFFMSEVKASSSGGASPSSSTVRSTTFGKDRFARVTVSWQGNQYSLYVDGRWLFTGLRNAYPSARIGTRVVLLSGDGLGNSLAGYYARNLLVSTKPVSFASHPAIKRPAFVGHSFVGRVRYVPTESYRDHGIGQAVGAAINARGIEWNFPSSNAAAFFTSGATILRSGGSPIKTDLDLMIAYKPDLVVYIGGTNDAINAAFLTNKAQIVDDLKLDIIDALGVAQRMVVCNVPSVIGNSANYATSQRDEYVRQLNAEIAALPAWWDATYPARAGALVVADLWSALGGANPPAANFWGTALGTFTDLHPSAAGNLLIGREIGQAIAATLGRNL
jgi:lysophospholipase L1-like esterase